MCIHMYIYIYMYTYMYLYIYIFMCIYTHIYTVLCATECDRKLSIEPSNYCSPQSSPNLIFSMYIYVCTFMYDMYNNSIGTQHTTTITTTPSNISNNQQPTKNNNDDSGNLESRLRPIVASRHLFGCSGFLTNWSRTSNFVFGVLLLRDFKNVWQYAVHDVAY